LTQLPTYSTKRRVEIGKSLHLMAEPAIPQRFEACFFGNDSILEASDFIIAEVEFLLDCGQKRLEFNSGVGCEEPEIVKVAGFIPCPVSKCDYLLSGNFVQAVDGHCAALGNVVELLVGSQNFLLLDGKEHGLRDGDVHFDRIWIREWALIAKIECVAVDMALPVFPIKGEMNPGRLCDVQVDLLQAVADLSKIRGPSKGEVEVFGETVVTEVTAFERGAGL